MKEAILLAALAGAIYFHSYSSAPPVPPARETVSAQHANVIVTAVPSYNRWKTGANAQTEFEPFAPSEQATWNQTPGYTITGRMLR